MYNTDEDDTQRGLRPWLPPSRGVGSGVISRLLVSGPRTVWRV